MTAIILLALLGGACVGSFIANVAARYAAGAASLFGGRSCCPHCHRALAIRDLVPIFSWIALKGRCRQCHAAIGLAPLVIEMLAALLAAISVALLPLPSALVAMALGWALLTAAAIDQAVMLLPDWLTLPLIAAGLLSAAIPGIGGGTAIPSITEALAGALVGYASLAMLAWAYRRLRGRDGLGGGDAKLFAAGGAWLGLGQLPTLMLASALLALAVAIMAGALRDPGREMPFGPAMCLVLWLLFFLVRLPAA